MGTQMISTPGGYTRVHLGVHLPSTRVRTCVLGEGGLPAQTATRGRVDPPHTGYMCTTNDLRGHTKKRGTTMDDQELYQTPDRSPLGQWDGEILEITRELRGAARDRDDATPGSDIHMRRQDEANRLNYRKAAFQAARPVLAKLYGQLADRHNRDVLYRRDAVEGAASYATGATFAGVTGGLFLLVGLRASWAPWWVVAIGIVLVLVSVGAVMVSVTASRDRPNTVGTNALASRVAGIEDACAACWDLAGLEAVEYLLDNPTTWPQPRRTGTEVAKPSG